MLQGMSSVDEKHGFTGTGCSGSCCLKVEGLSVDFGVERVLDDVSLHMHCGEIVALIGPNGAGKSTFLKAVLGQIPYNGQIIFHTADGSKMTPLIGYVPQNPGFDRGEPVSVQDMFVSFISRHPVFLPVGKRLRERILVALSRVHAEKLIDRQIGNLSGGELQRVLLALALEPIPNILILDEPTSGIDIDGVRLLTELLDEIRAKYDLSILLSTHDFAMLGRFATKVVLLKHKVLVTGTPKSVFNSKEFEEVFSPQNGRGGVEK